VYITATQLPLLPEVSAVTLMNEALKFVLKHHDATNRHFDFRLEYERMLLSWAMSKAPSPRIGENRSATMVPDHDLARLLFEGNIPPPRRGAGEVIVSDHGTYAPVVDGRPVEGRAQSLAAVRSGLQRGRLDFKLEGQKLTGTWTLTCVWRGDRGNEQSRWLLTKCADEVTDALGDVRELSRSVISGMTLEDFKPRG